MEETMQSNWNTFIKDLVYFTTRAPDKSDTSATRTTGVQHECNTSATGVIWLQHKYDVSAAQTTRMRHECYTNNASVTWVKKFDFDNTTSENIEWN